MKEEKRTLIHENAEIGKTKLNYLEALKERIDSKIIPSFLALNVGKFTNELLIDAIKGEGEKTLALAIQQANADLINMRTPSIKALVLADVKKAFDIFHSECEFIKTTTEKEMLPYVEIVNNKAKSVSDSEKMILEACKTFVNSPEEQAVFDALITICKGYDAFTKSIGERTRARTHPYLDIARYLTRLQNGKTIIDRNTDIADLAK